MNGLSLEKYLWLNCGDVYCLECLNKALDFALACEANFPLRCGCKRQQINVDNIRFMFTQGLLTRYDSVVSEWMSVHRTYCAKFMQFIDSKEYREDNRYSTCTDCEEETCRECKARKGDHNPGCPPDTDRQKLLDLGTAEKWKQCPSCGNLIEKSDGCSHMT
jgi:hypothetical protein